jgi:hypothetical protein
MEPAANQSIICEHICAASNSVRLVVMNQVDNKVM